MHKHIYIHYSNTLIINCLCVNINVKESSNELSFLHPKCYVYIIGRLLFNHTSFSIHFFFHFC